MSSSDGHSERSPAKTPRETRQTGSNGKIVWDKFWRANFFEVRAGIARPIFFGGLGRNRTGVTGFADQRMTSLPRGLNFGGLQTPAFPLRHRTGANLRIILTFSASRSNLPTSRLSSLD